jgi:transposase
VRGGVVYLRHTVVRKGGRTHTYWRLVRSVRRGGKVVQETVAQLGELDAEGRASARLLAQQLLGAGQQRELFEDPGGGEQKITVRLDQVGVERARAFGGVWLGCTVWRALKLDELCAELMPPGRERIAWAQLAAVLVIARLTEPSSELHIAENWYRTTALEDLLGLPAESIYDNRLYRALDRLLPHKQAIERHLRNRLGELFGLQYDLLLYDVTSTYFEGMAEANPLAARGYSRDHRPDCKQVCIALVVTREGMPLGYEVFAGNRHDATTVEEIVTTMEARFGVAHRIWVMDRGMTSAENVSWLQHSGRRYLIGTPKSELRKWSREIAEAKDWNTVRQGVEAKLCVGPDGAETFVLCRSVERRAKEQAMHDLFAQRIEQGLGRLGERLKRARKALERGKLERQIGRLLGRNTRAAGRYLVELVEDTTVAAGLRLQWSVKPEWDDWARHSEGCYVLRTNIADWSAETLWLTYIQLTEAEAAFRIHKSQLSLRPIWHQRADRVQAHILVCFLAYVMWKTLEQWQSRAGLGNSPRTILDELGRIQSTDVVLPLAEDPSRKLRIRCVVKPDPAQAMLLHRLGLRLPERLRAPPSIPG